LHEWAEVAPIRVAASARGAELSSSPLCLYLVANLAGGRCEHEHPQGRSALRFPDRL